MILLPTAATSALATLINVIMHTYFDEAHTTCIMWHPQLDLQLSRTHETHRNYVPLLQIWHDTLQLSFGRDIYNFTAKEQTFSKKRIPYDALITKLTVAIEHTQCEAFIAFQEHIPLFIKAFAKASTYSIWRSQRVKFMFIYYASEFSIADCLHTQLFIDQPNILVVEAVARTADIFQLKAPKFQGSRFKNATELLLIDRFNATTLQFEKSRALYNAGQLKNLLGREVVLGIVDYPPFGLYRSDLPPNTVDHNANNPMRKIFMDGCEVQILRMFCVVYNCTLQTDSSETESWGTVYPNISGAGTLGLLANHKIDVLTGAVYHWHIVYQYFDLSNYFGFSGVTCMVPRAKTLASWNLPLRPFQLHLWLGIAACLFIEALALMTSRQVIWLLERSEGNWWANFKFGYITALKLYVSQSSTIRETSNTVRTILFSCYMIDIIITSIYGGGLASILTLPIMGEAPDTVERMFKYKLKWAGQTEMWLQSFIQVVDDPVLVGIRELNIVMPIEEMAEKAKTEYMGFVVEETSFGNIANIDYLTNEAINRLKLMLDFIFTEYTVSFTLRLWPLLANYNQFILAYHSSGFDKFWEWKTSAQYLNGNTQQRILLSKDSAANIGPVKLTIDHFAGLLLIWTTGMTLSLLVFIGELYARRQRIKAQRLKTI